MTSGPTNLLLFIFKICFKTFSVRFHLKTVPVPLTCNERSLLLWSSWSVTQPAMSCDKCIIYTWSRGFQLSRSWELLSSWGYLLGKILTLWWVDPGQQLSLQPLVPMGWGKESKNKWWRLVGWDKESFVSGTAQRLLWRKLTPSHPAKVQFCKREEPSGAEEVRDCRVWLQNWIQQSWECLKENLVKEKQNTVDKGRKKIEKRVRKCFRCWSRASSAPLGEIMLEEIFTLQAVGDAMLEWWMFPEESVARGEPTLEQV